MRCITNIKITISIRRTNCFFKLTNTTISSSIIIRYQHFTYQTNEVDMNVVRRYFDIILCRFITCHQHIATSYFIVIFLKRKVIPNCCDYFLSLIIFSRSSHPKMTPSTMMISKHGTAYSSR